MSEERKWLTPNHLDALDWVAFVVAMCLVIGIGLYAA